MKQSFTTPDLCDEFPDLILPVESLFNSYGGMSSFSGEIVTVKCFEDNSKVKHLVDTDGTNKVMVIDAGGSKRRACLGDMLAEKAIKNSWNGFVIFGCVRDVEILETLPLGIFAIGTHPMKTDKRDRGDINIPVTFGGVTFSPGHYIYADKNGIIITASALTN
ncbi:MAG: ribonuclease activity regulator protein RraA [Gammaproteobacteria bacterium]|nr:MAG: ribonuclease activity regulator protein RraA [Gammaproteobacteria bacterium]